MVQHRKLAVLDKYIVFYGNMLGKLIDSGDSCLTKHKIRFRCFTLVKEIERK